MKGGKRKRMREDSDSSDQDDDLLREVLKISSKVSKILDVKTKMNWPVGLSSLLQDTFKCSICHTSPLQPPPIFARCCRSIVGCQACVDRWYRGEPGTERKCPLCRGDRGYADTCRIVGLDVFLKEINGLVKMKCHVPPPPDSDTEL